MRLDHSLLRLDAYIGRTFFTLRLFQTYLVSENLSIVKCPSHHTKIISERCTASRLLFGPVLPLCPLAARLSLTPHNNQNQPATCARVFTAVVFEHRVFFFCWQKKTYDWLQAHGVTDDVYTHWQMWIFRDLPFTHLVSTPSYIGSARVLVYVATLPLDAPPATDTALSRCC